jgi:RepB DNA-primase from phage plasmid
MSVHAITEEITADNGAGTWLSGGKVVHFKPEAPKTPVLAFPRLHAAADPVARPDEGKVREFLTIISGHAARAIGDAERTGFLQLSRLHPSGGAFVSSRFAIGDVDAMVKTAFDDSTHGHNVYVEARTVRADIGRGKRGDIEDSEWVFAFAIDADHENGKGGKLLTEPTLSVESSPGNSHHWYVLDRAISAGEAEPIGKAVRSASGADSASGKPTQPYRVAGTPNFPNAKKRARGRGVAPTFMIKNSGKLWTPAELLASFKQSAPGRVYDEDDATDQGTESTLPPDLLNLIKNGAKGDDRSAEFQSVVWKLKHRRWSADSIVTLFEKYPEGISHKYVEGDRLRDEVRRSYDKLDTSRSELPVVVLAKGQLDRIVNESQSALVRKGVRIFSRGGALVYPVREEWTAPNGGKTVALRFNRLTMAPMRLRMQQSTQFVTPRLDKETKEWVNDPADPPKDVAETILSNEEGWPFPRVSGIITIPLLRPNGTLLAGDKPRYDAETGLYYVPSIQVPPIHDHPTRENATASLNLLTDLLVEFAFKDGDTGLDRSVALSGLLTAVLRGSMSTAPMHFARAHAAGSGKSLLIDTYHTIVTGQVCAPISAPKDPDELEKRLGGLLRSGVPIISIDNTVDDLDHPTLCTMLTQQRVTVRILGHSDTPTFDCRAAIFGTGNNVAVKGDMSRRTLICNLDAGVEKPEDREFSHHPLKRVLADRGKYIAAVLTIVRAYLRAGAPRNYSKPYGSYEEWSRMVRGPLIWLGERDPVESKEEIRASDPERAAIREFFCSELLALDTPYRTGQIIAKACDDEDFADLMLRVAGTGNDAERRTRLGQWLNRIKGRPVDGRILVRGGSGTRPAWQIQEVKLVQV